ncbi:putative mitochondrial protein [Cucumis melo var. makuwa]|uniref:Mitochondrial protein n=1 Tax=Cucumis melo var. makuwa TaxID=1194695 RepID=A0A5A7VJ92_CUCMM|nr:putative mitochondrial protein [Cucumis melo var. makuwa]
MKGKFEMSMVGKLTFFLGFQIQQEETDIFFSQEKYAKNLVSKFGMDKAKPKRTLAATHLKMTKDTAGEKIDSSLYQRYLMQTGHVARVIGRAHLAAVFSGE